MIDPSYALQQAVYAALSAHAGVRAIVGTNPVKVFHTVPPKTALPYVVIGQDTVTGDDDAAEFTDCEVVVHAFAETIPGAKLLAAQITDALYVALPLAGFSTHEFHRGPTRHLTDPGNTGHSVVEFEYRVQALPT